MKGLVEETRGDLFTDHLFSPLGEDEPMERLGRSSERRSFERSKEDSQINESNPQNAVKWLYPL
jgi:hypothetical protein